ncbi:MAG: LacI family DNA-binding transcriptional regulator [Eubacteriales bacterium]|nr:LacI family DNA-binding transcriptional regulator [Eubacteriales bacterium]
MRTTIKDVAREAGVSVSTVTYALKKKGKITKASHKRVWEAVERLNYVPDATARSLVGGKTNSVGIIMPPALGFDFSDPHILSMLAELSKTLSHKGYWMSLYMPERMEDEFMRQFLMDAKIDGLIWMVQRPTDTMVRVLECRNLPSVAITYGKDLQLNTSAVVMDDGAGMEKAVDYLYSLGHRRILYIARDAEEMRDRRVLAYLQRVKDLGLDYCQMISGHFSEKITLAQLSWFWRVAQERPTAILAGNDIMALAAMKALAQWGIRVPDEVSVMGFDDIPAAAQAMPALTTMAQPVSEMINRACDHIFEAMEQEERTHALLPVEAKLIVRQSTAALN